MKKLAILIALALPITTNAEDAKMQLGMYVAVADLDVATAFYSDLFSTQPYAQTATFAGYELAGGRFGLLKEEMYSAPLVRGNNAVLNIKVDNIESEYVRVKGLNPALIQEQITSAGNMRLFMFKDPDGNVIEFFSLD